MLPIGGALALERVVTTVRRAGVDDVVVVTGHRPEALAGVLEGLGVRSVHNPGYASGMFSSVRAGAAALSEEVEAFFILPADHALVRCEVLEQLITVHGEKHPGVIHPTCCGRRGHPPLLPGSCREALLSAGAGGTLHHFLQQEAAPAFDVEVEDLTVLMDMDTGDDYQRVCRFAAAIDGTSCVLREVDAAYLLTLLEVPEKVARHCRAVAAVAGVMARALVPHVPALDAGLTYTAGLLHDMARACATTRRHAAAAGNMLTNLGLARLGSIVGAHMVFPPQYLAMEGLTEAHLVYLADKLVVEDRLASLEQRAERTLRKLGGDSVPPDTLRGLETRMQTAQMIQDRAEAVLGRPLVDVLLEVGSRNDE